MRRAAEEESQRWLHQAVLDLEDAEFASSGKRYHLACFLAQQSAEKALKAYLYYHGTELAWGHSVAELCQDAASFDSDFAGLLETAAPLDKYYIPTRYPNGLPGGIPSRAFSSADASLAISAAATVLDFVRDRLGST